MEFNNFGNFFDMNKTIANDLFKEKTYPWQVLSFIREFIIEFSKNLDKKKFYEFKKDVWCEDGVIIAESAVINGPAIICKGAEIRHGAFIRSSAIIGENCVVGNSTEIKNAILFDGVQVPHYNYVGDSILGYKSHLGAGVILSNVRSDRGEILVKAKGEIFKTGLRKFGAIISDGVEIGCNSVLNPGTIIGRDSIIYPLSSVRGVIEKEVIFKASDNICKREMGVRE